MSVTLHQLEEWLGSKEDEHLEFKEAKHNFHFEKLVKYCAALANEGGGAIILGVTDKIPRRIVGTMAFDDIERTKAGLVDDLRLRISVDEVRHRAGRVLVFSVPSRPTFQRRSARTRRSATSTRERSTTSGAGGTPRPSERRSSTARPNNSCGTPSWYRTRASPTRRWYSWALIEPWADT